MRGEALRGIAHRQWVRESERAGKSERVRDASLSLGSTPPIERLLFPFLVSFCPPPPLHSTPSLSLSSLSYSSSREEIPIRDIPFTGQEKEREGKDRRGRK